MERSEGPSASGNTEVNLGGADATDKSTWISRPVEPVRSVGRSFVPVVIVLLAIAAVIAVIYGFVL